MLWRFLAAGAPTGTYCRLAPVLQLLLLLRATVGLLQLLFLCLSALIVQCSELRPCCVVGGVISYAAVGAASFLLVVDAVGDIVYHSLLARLLKCVLLE